MKHRNSNEMCVCITIGLSKTPNGVNYAGNVCVKNESYGIFPSNKIAQQCPSEIIDFLEKRIIFTMPPDSAIIPNVELNSTPIQGPPLEILG